MWLRKTEREGKVSVSKLSTGQVRIECGETGEDGFVQLTMTEAVARNLIRNILSLIGPTIDAAPAPTSTGGGA